jgi:hypothetical protein
MSVIKKANLSEKDFKQVMAIVDALLNFYSKSQAIAGVTGVVQTMADKLPQGKIEGGGGLGGKAGGASGYAVIAGTIVGMLIAGEAIILAAKQDFDVNKLNAIGSIIDPLGNMFLKAALVAGAGTALGTVITGSSGLAVAALAAGLGAIGTVVAAMIGTAEYMIKAAASLQGDGAQIKAKAEAMSAIITAISGMMTAAAEVIRAMPFSLFEFASTREDKFKKIQETFENIFGKTNDSGIKGIIKTILSTSTSINEKNAGIISATADVFAAIGSIVGGIGKALEAMNSKVEGSAIFGLVKSAGSTLSPEVLGAVNNFLDVFMGRSQTLVDTILTAVQNVPVDKAEAIGKAGGGIAQIISAVGSMISSLSSGLSSFVKKTSEDKKGITFAGLGAVSSTVEKFDAEGFSSFIDKLEEKLPKINQTMKTMLGLVSNEAISMASQLTPEKIEGIKTLISLVTSVASMMNSLMPKISEGAVKIDSTTKVDAAGSRDLQAMGGFAFSATNIILPDLTSILESISKSLPEMIRRILNVIHEVPVTPSDVQKLKSIDTIFQTVGTLIDVVSKIMPAVFTMNRKSGTSGSSEAVTGLDIPRMKEFLTGNFSAIADTLEALVSSNGTGPENVSVFQRIAAATTKIPTINPQSLSKLKGLKDLFASLNEMNAATAPLMSLASDTMRLENGVPAWKQEINFDLSPIATGIESLSSPDSGIEKLVTAAGKLGTSIDAGKIQKMAIAAEAVKGFFSQVNVLSNAASFGMKTAIDAGLVKTAEEIKNHIGAMAKAMAEFQTQIDAINVTAADNINVKLGKTANGLGVKDANYSFTKNGVTLKFNVNVHMDAKQVSAEASKPGTVIFDAFAAGFPEAGRVTAGDNGSGVKVGQAAGGKTEADK